MRSGWFRFSTHRVRDERWQAGARRSPGTEAEAAPGAAEDPAPAAGIDLTNLFIRPLPLAARAGFFFMDMDQALAHPRGLVSDRDPAGGGRAAAVPWASPGGW
jgi:hypothetical protein